MHAIISTGHGRLHLIQSACAIQDAGVDVKVITGWAPRHAPRWMVNAMGRLMGRTNLASSMSKRRPDELTDAQIIGCAGPELYLQAMSLMSRLGLLDRTRATCRGWEAFGRSSRKHLHGADIFHVRSGAGRGRAIATAKEMAMKVLVDHSIAHPQTMFNNLSATFRKHHRPLNIKPDDPFWRIVLEDCAEADWILVNSSYVRDTFLEAGFSESQIKLAKLGIRKDFWGLKQSYQRGNTLRLLFTGAFGLRKGADVILDAAAILDSRGVDFHFDVVGVPDQALLAENDVAKRRFTFHGFVPQDHLMCFFQQADMYVFPSYAEGAAQSALEAMSAGLPVILTHESGASLRDRENGLLIPRGDAEALACAIQELSDNEPLRRLLGENARRTIAEEHTWSAYGRTVADVYRGLMASR